MALLERRLRKRLMEWWKGAARRLLEGKPASQATRPTMRSTDCTDCTDRNTGASQTTRPTKAESPGGDVLGRLDGDEWLDAEGLLEEVVGAQEDAAKRGVRAAGVVLDMALAWDLVQEEVLQWAREYSGALITKVTDDVREKVREIVVDGLVNGDPWNEVQKRIMEKGFPEYRAEMIARTEVIRAFTQGAVAGYKASGVVVGLRWLDGQPGACRLCSALDGKVVKIGEGFYAGGDGLPPRHPNCRCAVAPVTKEEAEQMGEPVRSYLLG